MARKKKTITNIEITGIADRGKAVGRNDDGQVVFVDGVAPGDVVDVLVLRKKKGFMQGVVTNFHKYSEDRVEPFCTHFGVCGGCKWQHVTYESQLSNKEQVVKAALQRIGKVAVKEFYPILPSLEPTYYRNKMEYTFSNKRWLTKAELHSDVSNREDVLGFHIPGAFDKIVNITHCHLQYEPSNLIRNTVRQIAIEQGLSFFDLREQKGFLRHIMIRMSTLQQAMLIVVFYEDDEKKRTAYLDEIIRRLPQVTSLGYCINPKKNDYILDLPMKNYHGPDYIEEQLDNIKFRIGPKSFFQTNTRQAERLFQIVRDFAGLNGEENVYDLYTGIGSIALFLAKDCKQVVGIEEVAMAIEDAQKNRKLNGIENAVFYAGDVKDILTTKFAAQHGKPDVLITDPPRAGMHEKVVQMLLQLAAPKIVYVSCNPATQARDLALLDSKYEVLKVQPVDMFPHTHHVETVALLQLRNGL